MADFTARAPGEPEKTAYVHERGTRPSGPALRPFQLARENLGLIAGFVLSLGFTALAFQARASWEWHRDWVVPVVVPLLSLGGMAMGHLIVRRQWAALGPGMGCLALSVAMAALNIWRGALTEGGDGLRDAMSLVSAGFLALAIALLSGALFWVEARRPTRVPAPEA
jgi:hypothetical protein